MSCPRCGLEHPVRECRSEDGPPTAVHADRRRYFLCDMKKGGCGNHWPMTAAQASILDQEKKAFPEAP